MKANLDKNLAPAWVSGKSYSTGEFCLYNKRLYICTTDNSDAEFDNSKWERRNLVDLVSGGNSNLNNMEIVDSFFSVASTATLTYEKEIEIGQIAILTATHTSDTNFITVSDENAVLTRTISKACQPSNLAEYEYWHLSVVVKPTKETGKVTIGLPHGRYWTSASCIVLG